MRVRCCEVPKSDSSQGLRVLKLSLRVENGMQAKEANRVDCYHVVLLVISPRM